MVEEQFMEVTAVIIVHVSGKLLLLGCSQYTIVPAQYAYLLKTDITDAQASILERKSSL